MIGRGRWIKSELRPELAPLMRSRYEPILPAREIKVRVQCAQCWLDRMMPDHVIKHPAVARLLAAALADDKPEDLLALQREARLVSALDQRIRGILRGRGCEVCGRLLFDVERRSTRRYCSDLCRSKARRRRERAGKLLQLGAVAKETLLSRADIERLTEAGELPCYRRGDRRYWKAEDIHEWLQQLR